MDRVIFLGLLLLCGGLLPCGNSATAPSAVERGEGDFTSNTFLPDCSEIPDGALDLNRNLTLSGPISCEVERVLIIPEGQNIMVKAEGAMKFERVHFFVAPGAQLTLAAENGITLIRNEELDGVPIIEVGGQLIVHAGQRDPTGTLPDEFTVPGKRQQDLIDRIGYGSMYTENEVAFTKNAIVFSSVDDSSKATLQQAKEETDQPETTEEGNIEDGNMEDGNTLKAGQVLWNASLKSGNRANEVWVGRHGSIMFAEYFKTKTAKNGQIPMWMETTTLIAADPGKVKGMLAIRDKLAHETEEGGGRSMTSRPSWTPWGRAYNRRVQRAKEHAGEAKLSMDNRACLEVTVDGSCVLSRSGQFRREWINVCMSYLRKKSSEYELCVVDDGLEVQLEGKKVWGVCVPKPGAG